MFLQVPSQDGVKTMGASWYNLSREMQLEMGSPTIVGMYLHYKRV
jgi:hypothetical protein